MIMITSTDDCIILPLLSIGCCSASSCNQHEPTKSARSETPHQESVERKERNHKGVGEGGGGALRVCKGELGHTTTTQEGVTEERREGRMEEERREG